MTQAFSRIEASSSAARVRVSDAFKNEDGAFDLPSILVGVVVVGILTAGVLASIFGVIPFAQDKAAAQDLGAITTAEGTYKAQQAPVKFGAGSALVTAELLSASTLTKVGVDSNATHWAAVTKSGSGKFFKATDVTPDPAAYTPADATKTVLELATLELPAP